MKKFKFEFSIPDDFEIGNCDDCIFWDVDFFDDDDDGMDYREFCQLYYSSENCLLEEVKC